MLDFKIYKPLRSSDLLEGESREDFAKRFALSIERVAGTPIQGTFEGEGETGFVHLNATQEAEEKVFWALDDLGLSFGMGI
jgi:hypothetical protein